MNGTAVVSKIEGGGLAPSANGAAPQAIAGAPVAQPIPAGQVVEIGGVQYQLNPVLAPPAETPADPVQVVTPAPVQTAPVPVAQPVQAQPTEEPEAVPSVVQRVKAAAKGKAQLMAERDSFKGRAEQAEQINQQLRAQVLELQKQVQELGAEIKGVEKALGTEQEKNTTVAAAVADEVAAAGFAAENLPEQTAAPTDTIESLRERLASGELSPEEAWALDAKLEQMEKEAKSA